MKSKDLLRILIVCLVIFANIGGLLLAILQQKPDLFFGILAATAFGLILSYMMEIWDD